MAAKPNGDKETRTPDLRRAKASLSQLSYVPMTSRSMGMDGLEPSTSRLSGECSNQLSYIPQTGPLGFGVSRTLTPP